jgi:hypothetical protein
VYDLAYDNTPTCSDRYAPLQFPDTCTLAANSNDDGNDDEGA